MNKLKKFLIPAAIIAFALIAKQVITSNPPENKRFKPSKAPQMTVEVLKLIPQDYQVELDSFGTVKPRTQSALVAQVSGQIHTVNAEFRDGGFFEQGDTLVQVDNRDYVAEVKIAQSSLMTAKQALLEEQARTEQAKKDWSRLGNGTTASDLVLRKPQLAAAQANVLSAEAKLQKSELALERTKIVAPYAGRILRKHVDFGQVISNNMQIADIYAVDYVEVRLPIKNNDLALINLPEEFRNNAIATDRPLVHFSSDLMGQQLWQGTIVRTESAIDDNSQQLYIVAQINNPFDLRNTNTSPIKIGQYVTAKIQGKTIPQAIVIPNSAIYQGSYVYVEQDGVLFRKDIEVRWQNAENAIIKSGLSAGENLVITPLGQVSSGTPVSIFGDKKAKRNRLAIKPNDGKRAGKQSSKPASQQGSNNKKGNGE